LNWLIRGLTVVGGVVSILLGWPIAEAAWRAQRTDAVVYALRTGKQVTAKETASEVDAISQAIAFDPSASRYLLRSELLASSALTPSVGLEPAQRTEWLRRARADLIRGLANAPANGVGWLRLAAVQQQLDGPSRRIVSLLFRSLQLSAAIPQVWPAQLRLMLDCWPYLRDAEKERLKRQVEMIWRQSADDRRLFGYATRSAADHAILTWFLRDVPEAPQELAKVIGQVTKQ
jgi:hypothetical protein